MAGSNGGVVAAALLLSVVTAAAGTTSAANAQEEAGATCAGHPVTISWDDPGVGRTINGTPGPDVIQGGPATETINAGGGEDTVCGGDGIDTIDGGPGRDELVGQAGSDTFKGPDLAQDVVTGGRQSLDTADYSAGSVGVEANMTTALVHASGAGVNGGVLGIEAIVGTAQADRLVGHARANLLEGRGGDDVLDGRGGNDLLYGGGGNDRAVYTYATASVRASLYGGAATVGPGEDDVDGLHDIEALTGSSLDDVLGGSDDNDQLTGGAGDDVVKGKGGDDVLVGNGGNDVIHPGPGDDYVDGGTNDPVTSSGAPGDLVSYQGDSLDADAGGQFSAYLYVHPYFGDPPGASGVGEDVFAGVESVRGVKNETNILQGNDGPNVIIGGPRIDLLEGRGGNDLLYGLEAPDSIDAGPGDDYLDGGRPTGPDDSDLLQGGDGDDTCLGATAIFRSSCETVG